MERRPDLSWFSPFGGILVALLILASAGAPSSSQGPTNRAPVLIPAASSGGGGGAAGPAIASFTSDPGVVTAGEPVTLRVDASGVAPLSYAYAGLPGGCASANASSLTCRPNDAGTSNVTVTVTDASGIHARANLTLYVRAAPAPTLLGLPLLDAYALVGVLAGASVLASLAVRRVRRRRTSQRPTPPERP